MRQRLSEKKWPETTIVKLQSFTGRTFVDGIEVVFDKIDGNYSPIERPVYIRQYTEYDLREF